MRKKILSCVLAIAMTCSLLTGCGATTESVLEKSAKKIAEAKSQAADMTMELGIDVKSTEEDVSMSMGVGFEGSVASTKVSDTSSLSEVNGKFKLDVLGVSANIDIDTYLDITGDDKSTTTTVYIKTSEDDSWSAQSVTEDKTSTSADFIGFVKDKLVLSKDLVEVDSVKCYELTGSITGEELYTWIKNVDSSLVEEIDDSQVELLGNLVADIIYDINKKTYLPEKLVVDFTNSDLTSALQEELGESVTVDISKLSVIVDYKQFGGVEVTLPDDVKNIEVEEADSESISNILKEESVSVEEEVESEVPDTSDLTYGSDEMDYVSYVDNYYPHVNEDETFGITSYDLDGEIVIKIDNLTDETVVGDGAIRFYDADGNIIDASSLSTAPISANGSDVETAYCDESYDSYKIAIISDTVYDEPIIAEAEYVGKEDEDAVFNVTNTGNDIDSNYFIVLFYKGDELVDYAYTYSESEDELKSGETGKYTAWSSEDWDRCELIVRGYAVD